ncbi:MAG: fibronectin type III domain-containing protein [Acidobacteriaceae bacterium]
MNRKLLISVLALLSAVAMTGCGSPGAPEPPSLNLPAPVIDLSVSRIGDSVRLAWTMPTHTLDHLPLKRPVTVQVCREVENAPCVAVETLNLKPGVAGAFTDTLPPDLKEGPERLLRYEVVLRNHAGKSAGPSNAAYSAAGAAPASITGLTGTMQSDGVLLSWQRASGGAVSFRIERDWLTAPQAEKNSSPLVSPAPPARQTLLVHPADGLDTGHAIDNSVLFDQKYRYLLERVATVSLSGRKVEVQGIPSESIEVATTDKFPPAVPEGLAAVGDSAGGAIDLSWSPNRDNDLAGYRVYRRDVHGNLPAERIASLGVETSFRDTGIQPGHTYAYSVSAVDLSGNESKPSPETEETLSGP